MFKTLIPAALLAAGLATPAAAQSAPVFKVAYADLDLASAAGQRTLDARLNAAISRACGDDFSLHGATEAGQIRICKAQLRKTVNVQREAAIAAAAARGETLAAR